MLNLNPLESIKREYYFRRAYRKFETAAETASKENSFSPRRTEAHDQVGEAMEFVYRALDGEASETEDFEAGMFFATLTDQDFEPVEYEEFKEYFESLEEI